jgi:hypothetical protein
MIQKYPLALIFITNCLHKRFQTEGNTYSLKRFVFRILKSEPGLSFSIIGVYLGLNAAFGQIAKLKREDIF